jgi:predicted DNA-binding protein YlxM (UPF0122 family)
MLKSYQKTNPKRKERIKEYREKGYSLNQIAAIFHITKQRVSQIIGQKKVGEK